MKIKSKILLIILLAVLILPKNAHAQNNKTYYINSNNEIIEEIYATKAKELSIGKDSSWLSNLMSYVIVTTYDDRNGFYFNVPNLQLQVLNYATNLLPRGYNSTGRDLYEENKNKHFNFVPMEPFNTAPTGMHKYGFHLPNPAYLGEYPRVQMSLMGIILEDNIVDNVVKFFKSIFGGDVITAPEESDIKTLKYISPNDYFYSTSSFERWIEKYWEKTKNAIEPGQIIVSPGVDGVDKEGNDKDGNLWVWENLINGSDIKDETNSEKINKLLKEYSGKKYQNIVSNILVLAKAKGIYTDVDTAPIRTMPYERDTLTASDFNALNIDDPRVYNDLEFFGNKIQFEALKTFFSPFTGFFIDLAGTMSEFTVFLQRFSNFTQLESNGLDPLIIFKNPAVHILLSMIVLFLLFYLLKKFIAMLRGKVSSAVLLSNSVTMIFFAIFSYNVILNPQGLYNVIKDLSIKISSIEAPVIGSIKSISPLIEQGDEKQKSEAILWVPYFDLWTEYHTNHKLMDKANTIDDKSLPELTLFSSYTKLNGTEVPLYSTILADALSTKDTDDDLKMYRVVDHFMAPRLYDINLSPTARPLFKTKHNENFNGKIQSGINIGSMLGIFFILILIFTKVILFYEFIFEIIMFPLYLANSIIDERMFKDQIKRVPVALLRLPILSLFIVVVMWAVLALSGMASLVLLLALIYFYWKMLLRLMQTKSVWSPRMFIFLQTFLDKKVG